MSRLAPSSPSTSRRSASSMQPNSSTSRTWLATALFVVSACTVSACGGSGSQDRRTIDLARLRGDAAARPNDPLAQRALGEAELLAENGASQDAHAPLARAVELAPTDVRAELLLGVELEVHGQHRAALTAYLTALELASGSDDPWAPAIAEVAIASIAELDDAVPSYVELTAPRLRAVFDAPGAIGRRARHTLGSLLIDFALRADRVDDVAPIAAALGCVTETRAAGPFGPRALLGFDRALEPEQPGPLAARYDYGPGRGPRDTRDIAARGCVLHLGGGPVGGQGTTYVESTITVPTAGRHTLRIETPNPVELFVDDVSVARVDRRTSPIGRTTFHELTLTAGEHRLMAKVSTRHPNPVLIVSVSPGAPDAEPTLDASPLGRYLDVTHHMARADWVAAREALGEVTPSDTVVLQILGTAVSLSDPLRAEQARTEAALGHVAAGLQRDVTAWYPHLQRARFEAENGRMREAATLLEEATRAFPEVLAIALARIDLLEARGWADGIDPELARLRDAIPTSCRVRRAILGRSLRRDRHAEVRDLAEELVRCDARSDARLQSRVRARDWAAAQTELARLARFEPRTSPFTVLDAELTLARGRGDAARADAIIAELSRLMPQSERVAVLETDRTLARGQAQEARTRLLGAIEHEPTMGPLRRLARAVFDDSPLETYRRDSAEIIRAFEASGRTYEDAPQVLVWDYTVSRLFPDGSVLELTHQIYRAQSEEVVDDLGQFSAPEDADVLTLRTIKRDGARLEPDRIAGLEHIEMPSVEVGDYVEYEYLRLRPAPDPFPQGAIGDRFYFQSFEVPFDTSTLTLLTPRGAEVAIDPRGHAPTAVVTERGDLTERVWQVHEMPLVSPEPGSVAAREYLPSIAWGYRASWRDYVESLVDALADRDIVDPAATRLARSIVGDEPSTPEQKAERLYRWVVANIDESNDLFGQGAAMVSARTGQRSRVYRYLTRLVGLESDIALVRSFSGDSTRSAVPDDETYGALLNRVRGSDQPVWLALAERGAAFGTLPPLLRGQDGIVIGAPFEEITVTTPPIEVDLRSVEVDATLEASGRLTATVVETYRGIGAALWRHDLESVPNAQLEDAFERNYVARLVPGATLRSLRITGREDVGMPLSFRYEWVADDVGTAESDARLLPSLYPLALTANFARLNERTHTQVVAPGLAVDLTIRLHLPENQRASGAPEEVVEGPHGASMRFVVDAQPDGLVLTRSLRLPRMRVSPNEYRGFSDFCQRVDEAEEQPISVR